MLKFDFVSSFNVKNISNTIKILVIEKKPVAVFVQEKKIFISDNGDLINYTKNENFLNLPILFGKKTNFHNLYTQLKRINFPINTKQIFSLF